MTKQPKITKRGSAAIEAANAGAQLYCFNEQRGWIAGDAAMLARANRMTTAGNWIYGVR